MNESWNKLASWILEDGWNRDQRKSWLKPTFRSLQNPSAGGILLEVVPKARTPQQTRAALHLPTLLGTRPREEGPFCSSGLAGGRGGRRSWGGRLVKDKLCSGGPGPGPGRGTGNPWCLLSKHCRVGRSCGRVFNTQIMFAGKYPQPALPAPHPHPSGAAGAK